MFPYFFILKIFNVFYLKLILLNCKGCSMYPSQLLILILYSARGLKFLSASSESNVSYFLSLLIKLLWFFPIYCQSYLSMILMASSNLDFKNMSRIHFSKSSIFETFLPSVFPNFPIRDNQHFNFNHLKIISNQLPPWKSLSFSWPIYFLVLHFARQTQHPTSPGPLCSNNSWRHSHAIV